MAKVNPYERILRAAQAGRGVRLTADEAWELAQDGAIQARAEVLAYWDRGECPHCQGKGHDIDGVTCRACRGSGKPEGERPSRGKTLMGAHEAYGLDTAND